MRHEPDLPPKLAAELEPDERVVWAGKPATVLANPKALIAAFFSLVWLGVWVFLASATPTAIAWLVRTIVSFVPEHADEVNRVSSGVGPVILVVVWVFVAIRGAIASGRLGAIGHFMRRTRYVLTDRRCIVRIPARGMLSGIENHSFGPARLGKMYRVDLPFGRGSVVFQRERLRKVGKREDSSWEEEIVPLGFLGIHHAEEVHRLVRDTLLDGGPHPGESD